MQLYRVYVLPNPSFPFTITVGLQVTVRWQSLTHNQDRVVAVFRRKWTRAIIRLSELRWVSLVLNLGLIVCSNP